jgi:hypothetical protein
MDTYSYALNRDSSASALKFYPFRRPFFHRAESLLDNLLFSELKSLGKRRAVETLTNSAEEDRKKKKILGKDYEPPKKQPKPTGDAGNGDVSQPDGNAVLPLRQKGGSTKKQQGGKDKLQGGKNKQQGGKDKPTGQPSGSIQGEEDVPLDMPLGTEKSPGAIDQAKKESLEQQTYANLVRQQRQQQQQQNQYQQQIYQQQGQRKLALYDYFSLGKDKFPEDKPKDKPIMNIEEPQTGPKNKPDMNIEEQQKPVRLNLVNRQLEPSQVGYLNNNVMVGMCRWARISSTRT